MISNLFVSAEETQKPLLPDTERIPIIRAGPVQIELADALDRYACWPAPTVIISDGAYGVGGFPGDPPTEEGLPAWYAPHIAAWSKYALPETTLWLWGVEVGWAILHPLLKTHGWEYRSLHIWDKGIAHIAGNVNSKTIRRFPVVTEVCAQYVKQVTLPTPTGEHLSMKQWLRHEWKRTGLPYYKTNEACGVKNAATRKYFTADHRWYYPPPEMMERIAAYANRYGKGTEWPYFSIDGRTPVTAGCWAKLRAKWNHTHAVTNVWQEPAMRGLERMKDENARCIHGNQKPLILMERLVNAASDPGDVVWEPFGGLCSVAVSCLRNNRQCYSAETNPEFFQLAKARLINERELNGRPDDFRIY